MKYFKCPCEHCGGRIEYPAASVGSAVACPHCGQETDLTLPPPAGTSESNRRHFLWMVAGLAILLLGAVGVIAAFVMLQRFARRVERPPR